jgi:hypothetical protein
MDTSVLLAASSSGSGASREIFRREPANILTLDRGDFGGLMDQEFYGLPVLKPGVFLERERAAGRLL